MSAGAIIGLSAAAFVLAGTGWLLWQIVAPIIELDGIQSADRQSLHEQAQPSSRNPHGLCLGDGLGVGVDHGTPFNATES